MTFQRIIGIFLLSLAVIVVVPSFAFAVHFFPYDFKSIKISPDPPLRSISPNGIATFDVRMEANRPAVNEDLVIGYWVYDTSETNGFAGRLLQPGVDFAGDTIGGSRCAGNIVCFRPGETVSNHTVRLQFPTERAWNLFLRVELYRGSINPPTLSNFVRGCYIPVAVEVGNPVRRDLALSSGTSINVIGPRLFNNVTVAASAAILTTRGDAGPGAARCEGDEVSKLQLFVKGDLNLSGLIDASRTGYHGGRGQSERGAGPGGGTNAHKRSDCDNFNNNGGGGSYGGTGRQVGWGSSFGSSAPTYGNLNLPLDYGSGGGGGHRDYPIRNRFGVQIGCEHHDLSAGHGGGAIYIKARRVTIQNLGSVYAEGSGAGYITNYDASGGGGSGGSVVVIAEELFSVAGCGGANVSPGWNEIAHWPQGQQPGTVVVVGGIPSQIGSISARGGGIDGGSPGGGGGGRVYVQTPSLLCGSAVPSPTLTVSATPTTVNTGQNFTLNWSYTNANTISSAVTGTGCPPAGSLSPPPPPEGGNGSRVLTAGASPTTCNYTFTAQGLGGSVTRIVAITVVAPPAAPTLTVSAPASVNVDQNFAISWTSTNATSVTPTVAGANCPAIPAPMALNGSATLRAPVAPTSCTYTLTATGPGGTVSRGVTVNVVSPPPPPPPPSGSCGLLICINYDPRIITLPPPGFTRIVNPLGGEVAP